MQPFLEQVEALYIATPIPIAIAITNKIVIKQLLKELDERDREIILLRFFKEKTQTEVARILGISQVQVSRIERKVLDKMKNKLTSA